VEQRDGIRGFIFNANMHVVCKDGGSQLAFTSGSLSSAGVRCQPGISTDGREMGGL
jgi:hypothetical protein